MLGWQEDRIYLASHLPLHRLISLQLKHAIQEMQPGCSGAALITYTEALQLMEHPLQSAVMFGQVMQMAAVSGIAVEAVSGIADGSSERGHWAVGVNRVKERTVSRSRQVVASHQE